MEASLFARILSDKSVTDLNKIRYKYPDADMNELVSLFKDNIYKTLPLDDFNQNKLVYMDNVIHVKSNAVKLLLRQQSSGMGLLAMEEEIAATFTIENIGFTRESVRRILRGSAPENESENRIYGMKKGLEYICDPDNRITQSNIHHLYSVAVGQTLPEDSRLKNGDYYRYDSVFIVGDKVEHEGLPFAKLAECMESLVEYIQAESAEDDLIKASVIHFYIALLHPYFDGNGRMARLLHLWYLHRRGYGSALFVPFSSYVERSRNKYYKAFSLVRSNASISHVTDITPFIAYFIENVYNRLADGEKPFLPDAMDRYQEAFASGEITVKERDLWTFVLSAYGRGEFSTKQIEKDYGDAAYATVRSFVLKFTRLGIFRARRMGSRTRYLLADADTV